MIDALRFSTALMMANVIFYIFTFLSLVSVNRKVKKLRTEIKDREELDKQLMNTLKEVITKIN